MTPWLVAWAISLAVAALSLALTYGIGVPKRLSFRTDFQDARYRRVGEARTGGPVLELGFTAILWLCILLLAAVVYPDEAARFVARHLRTWPPWALAAIPTLLSLWICVYRSPREHDQLIRGLRKIDYLPQDTQRRIRALWERLGREAGACRAECRANRRAYLPYLPYAWNNGLLFVPFFWLIVAGITNDWCARDAARTALEAARLPFSSAVVGEPLFARGEEFLSAFWVYQERMLQIAQNLTGVVATVLVLAYWILGTSFQLVYTGFVVGLMRVLTAVSLIGLVAVLGFLYLDLTEVVSDTTAGISEIAESLDAAELSLDDLRQFNDLRLRISEQVTVDSFWRRLVNSYGGILLLIGGALSLWVRRKRDTSLLHTLLGERGRRLRPTLRSILVAPEPTQPPHRARDDEAPS